MHCGNDHIDPFHTDVSSPYRLKTSGHQRFSNLFNFSGVQKWNISLKCLTNRIYHENLLHILDLVNILIYVILKSNKFTLTCPNNFEHDSINCRDILGSFQTSMLEPFVKTFNLL